MPLLFILLFFQTTSFAQDYTFGSLYRTLDEGKTYYILKDQSKVHTAPFITATTVAILSVSTAITVEERMDEIVKINGFRTNWYRVSFDNNGIREEGFVWGGNIAVGAFRGIENPKLLFLYGIDNIELVQRGDYLDQSIKLQLNVSELGVLKDQLFIEAIGTLYTNTQGQALGNKGLKNVQEVIEIAFSDGYCGGVSAATTVFWDGQKLHYVDLLSNGFSSEYFINKYFIYPTDKNGTEGKIILREEEGNYDSNKIPTYTNQKEYTFEWNGVKLISNGF